jgi:hypothetical protein
VGYQKQLWGVFHFLVLSVLREITVGHIAYGRLHVAEYVFPDAPGDAEGDESYEIEGMPSRCVYMHSPLPNTQFFHHNVFAKDSKCDKDFIPDVLSTLSAAWKYR